MYPGGDGNGSGSVEESIVDVGDGRELPGLDASFVDADGDDADGDDDDRDDDDVIDAFS